MKITSRARFVAEVEIWLPFGVVAHANPTRAAGHWRVDLIAESSESAEEAVERLEDALRQFRPESRSHDSETTQ